MNPGATLPAWFRQNLPGRQALDTGRFLVEAGLHTVCSEAKCPNSSFCFGRGQATFLILGDTCTRNCFFCAVKKNKGKNLTFDYTEPERIASVAIRLGLKYVVITSVTRDDLGDGGAETFARTVDLIRDAGKDIKVELLIPDFKGDLSSIRRVVSAGPDVLAHNIETVESLYPRIRPMAGYSLSLRVLSRIKEFDRQAITKSSLMLGLGETEGEVAEAMRDLRHAECDILTLGQYLSPSPGHYPVKKFIAPGQFRKYEEAGYALGFKKVCSGPLVRSSFMAEDVYREAAYA